MHGTVIGRYESDEVKPSIEMAAAITDALEVSLDYLIGNTDLLPEKVWSVKSWIFKSWKGKIKLISLLYRMPSYSPINVKSVRHFLNNLPYFLYSSLIPAPT